jgi:hypothetical protein
MPSGSDTAFVTSLIGLVDEESALNISHSVNKTLFLFFRRAGRNATRDYLLHRSPAASAQSLREVAIHVLHATPEKR